jgi:hypothetical protein
MSGSGDSISPVARGSRSGILVSLSSSPRPFPAEALRDALGLVRLLYAARRLGGTPVPPGGAPPADDPLVAIGRDLRAALSFANCEEGSLGYRAAMERGSRALSRLAEEARAGEGAAVLAVVARARVVGEAVGQAGR